MLRVSRVRVSLGFFCFTADRVFTFGRNLTLLQEQRDAPMHDDGDDDPESSMSEFSEDEADNMELWPWWNNSNKEGYVCTVSLLILCPCFLCWGWIKIAVVQLCRYANREQHNGIFSKLVWVLSYCDYVVFGLLYFRCIRIVGTQWR